jgi:pyruvate dehydrogenase E1 component alpha subunit
MTSNTAPPSEAAVDAGRAVSLLARMVLVREFELACVELKKQGVAKGPLHLCLGQEAVGVGATAALEPSDTITSTHRGHAHYLGKDADPARLMAEILGKEGGYGRGRAGHMLIADAAVGLLAGTGIVGGMVPVALGQALAFQVRSEPRVVLTFFGDGAANEGAFGECLNIASLWRLPLVFLCENNGYGLTVPVAEHLAGSVCRRAEGYDVLAREVDGNDVLAVYGATASAVQHARSGNGPVVLEARTYRMTGFSTGDRGGYQPEDEMARWSSHDPIDRLRRQLNVDGALDAGAWDAVNRRARDEVAAAIAFAHASPYPQETPHEGQAYR